MVEPPQLSYDVLDREGGQSRLLLLLHGYGEPTHVLSDRVELIDPEGRCLIVVPEAPFERGGRPIWHRAMSSRDEAEEQFRVSLAAIDVLLGELEARFGLAASDAVVGGFSQGGGLGLALLLAADVAHRPAAGFGICSFPPHVRGFRVDRVAAAGRPYLLSSAHDDHFAPIEVSRAGAVLLQETGLDLTYVESPGGHEMTDEGAMAIGAWLAALGRGERLDVPDLLAGVASRSEDYGVLWQLVS